MTSAAAARKRRRARFRRTALPTLRLTVNPTRTILAVSSSGRAGAAGRTRSPGARRLAWRMKPGVTHFNRAAATFRNSDRVLSRPTLGVIAALRGQALAALRAASIQDPAAADRRLAGSEPVAALADQHTRLESALHDNCSGEWIGWICKGVYGAAPGLSTTARRRAGGGLGYGRPALENGSHPFHGLVTGVAYGGIQYKTGSGRHRPRGQAGWRP